ncbi:glutamate carboxypeptidase [Novosphingobium sp. Chol11]|uniref:glutamate carboxypeptidase n=1 Tax=Novosphingobium sp. Chol11 TaxID=1385763 RepID=UPI0025E9DD9B|nr:glutamate carboxypeptidase [Novosphingobium sp. Chol11]
MRRIALIVAVLLANPARAAPDKALLDAAGAQVSQLTATLEQLVNIETGSGDAEGLAAAANYLGARFAALGANVERIKPLPGTVGDILVARMAGTGRGNLLLIGHMDTVYQRGALARAPFRLEGARAYGPGIADDKGGLAVILHALALLGPRDFKTLTIAINPDEETGSKGSGAIITELARGKDAVLSFEPTGIAETFLRGTSGTNTVIVTITGKSAHAGVSPEQGINALVEAAEVIRKTKDLDLGPGKQRFNWTVINQQRPARNIIPDSVVLSGDLRTASVTDIDAFRSEIAKRLALPTLAGAQVSVEVRVNRPPFTATSAGNLLIDRARAIYADLGAAIEVKDRWGGGTDAGYAALAGVPVIEALGLPGYGYHTGDAEYVSLDAVPRRLYLTAELIRQIGR